MSSTPRFDVAVDRHGTNAVKWDYRPTNKAGEPIHPMWVADMDFPAPAAVRRALLERAEHPVYGYSFAPAVCREVFLAWQADRNGWDIEESWLVTAPAVMPAVRAAILGLTDPGDEIIVQPPVYFPFFDAIRDNGRAIVENPLVRASGGREADARYEIDLDRLRASIGPRTKMLLFCSPHNPVGRVWSADELEALADVCVEHDIVILADEIHSDLTRSGIDFVPIASLGPEVASRTVATHSPSKTFNIAGLASAHVVVPDADLRARFQATLKRLGMTLANIMSIEASRAAYAEGAGWLGELLAFLDEQIAWFSGEIAARFARPWGVGMPPIEGTYLAWLDLRGFLERTGTRHEVLEKALFDDAALWLSEGRQFGSGGEGFFRMNLATPRANVLLGLRKLERALEAVEARS